jgi:hypothetical protein
MNISYSVRETQVTSEARPKCKASTRTRSI